MKKLILILVLAVNCFGANYYMSPTASDANPCSMAQPCATFQHVDTIVAPGDTVFVGAGNYVLSSTWDMVSSGTPGNPITWTPLGNGAVSVSRWDLRIRTAINLGQTPFDAVASTCTPNCQAYKLHTQIDGTTTPFFEDYIYNGNRRARNNLGFVNGLTNNGDTRVCVAGTSVSDADANCNCPTEVTSLGQHCAAQAPPCSNHFPTTNPYMCFNKFLYKNNQINCSWKGLALGDVEALNFVFWSAEKFSLTNQNCGNGVVYLKASTSTPSTQPISGWLPAHNYLVDNLAPVDRAKPGTWYLDRCPTNPNCSTAEALWDLWFFADTTIPENPNTNVNQFFPAANGTIVTTGTCALWKSACSDGMLIRANGIHDVIFTAPDVASPFIFGGDNYTVPRPLGLPDSEGQPLLPAAISFQDCANITWNGIQIIHTQAGGLEFNGSCNNFHITNAVVSDTNAFGYRIGKKAASTDTDTSIPNHFDITNSVSAFTGQTYPSGESSAMWIGNANNFSLTHNDVYEWYGGGIEICAGLNLGGAGAGNNSFNCFNFDVGYNNIYGRLGVGLIFGLLDDHAGIHTATNHAASCPKPIWTKPVLDADFCGRIHHNYIHDIAHNYFLDTAHIGAFGIYLDQGTSHVKVDHNYIVRIGYGGFFQNIASNPNFTTCTLADGVTSYPCQYLPTDNLYTNNLIAFVGSVPATNTSVIRFASIYNNRAAEVSRNLIVVNGNAGLNNQNATVGFQRQPGNWACFDDDQVTPVPCANKWLFDYNIQVDIANKTITYIQCKAVASCLQGPGALNTNNYYFFTGVPWDLNSSEDVHSLVDNSGQNQYDAHLINPVYPNDNFFPSMWPGYLTQIGFDNSFDYRTAGRQTNATPFITVQSEPTLLPKTIFINQTTDFTGSYTPTPVSTWSLKIPNGQYSSLTQRH